MKKLLTDGEMAAMESSIFDALCEGEVLGQDIGDGTDADPETESFDPYLDLIVEVFEDGSWEAVGYAEDDDNDVLLSGWIEEVL